VSSCLQQGDTSFDAGNKGGDNRIMGRMVGTMVGTGLLRRRVLAASVPMTSPRKPTPSPRFEPGDRVRVKSGVTVPDFEDIPLGGWTGTIRTVKPAEDQITYEIAWDRRTLDSMHPVYRKRCERDDCEVEIMWLGEEDIESQSEEHH
jgi:hypothetical protein